MDSLITAMDTMTRHLDANAKRIADTAAAREAAIADGEARLAKLYAQFAEAAAVYSQTH